MLFVNSQLASDGPSSSEAFVLFLDHGVVEKLTVAFTLEFPVPRTPRVWLYSLSGKMLRHCALSFCALCGLCASHCESVENLLLRRHHQTHISRIRMVEGVAAVIPSALQQAAHELPASLLLCKGKQCLRSKGDEGGKSSRMRAHSSGRGD